MVSDNVRESMSSDLPAEIEEAILSNSKYTKVLAQLSSVVLGQPDVIVQIDDSALTLLEANNLITKLKTKVWLFSDAEHDKIQIVLKGSVNSG
jgi:uncharacterized protein (DUF2342 family)